MGRPAARACKRSERPERWRRRRVRRDARFDGNVMLNRAVPKVLELAGLYGRPARVSTKVVWTRSPAASCRTSRKGKVRNRRPLDPVYVCAYS
jgi:hypothetical protein